MKKVIFLLGVMIVLSSACATASLVENMDSEKALTKFSRGVTNLATSPGEYVYQIPKAMKDSPDYLTGYIMAIGRGTGYMLLRAASGIYDLVTFPFPGKTHYGPIMKPETISDKVLNYATN